jgi:hypothetical protein
LIEGLRGEADRRAGNGNSAVSVLELAQYLSDRVPALSQRAFNRTQVPMHRISGEASFDVTLVE